jgi:hypothetical protein
VDPQRASIEIRLAGSVLSGRLPGSGILESVRFLAHHGGRIESQFTSGLAARSAMLVALMRRKGDDRTQVGFRCSGFDLRRVHNDDAGDLSELLLLSPTGKSHDWIF